MISKEEVSLDNVELKAATRTTKGNSPARALRRQGLVPAVLYGPDSPPSMLAIQVSELDTIIKRGGLGRSVFNLYVDGGQSAKPVMIKELQTHPLSKTLLHVDFYEVSMDRKIHVNVPVIITGKSIGVENGGMLQIICRELEVTCLPNAIPSNITIDITNLDIGDTVHVEDIPLSGNIEIPHETNFTVLTVSTTKREIEAVAPGEPVEGEPSEEESPEA
ncbi:MAG: 50S ribosomal protein L25 [Desulfobacteraceae bacterium]|nr:MAG: 50S ribosomal protein L25 [Desulfobacteraceae bacterium]